MEPKTIWERFLKFEKENDMFLYTYHKIPYWHLIRNFEIYKDKIRIPQNNSTIARAWAKRSVKERINSLLRALFQLKYILISPKEELLLVSDRRIRIIDGKERNQILFPIEEWDKFQKKYYNVDAVYNENDMHEMNLSLLNIIMGVITLKVKLKNKFELYHNSEIKRWVDNLNNEFHCACSSREIEQIIDRYTSYFKFAVKYYKRVIKNFKAIVIVCHYEFQRMVLIAAAKECGIPTIELQHGILSEDHIAYNFYKQAKPQYLPDLFLDYGQFWEEACNFKSFVPMKTVGNPLFEHCTSLVKEDETWKDTVVLYSGSGAGKRLIKLAEEFLRSDVGKSFRVIFKCHPKENSQWRDIYPELANSRIEVIADDSINVYDLFFKADYHIAGESTVLYEVLAYGKYAMYCQMSITDNGCFEKLIEQKLIEPVYNCQQLEEKICFCTRSEKQSIDVDYIFERNSEQKILSVIEEVVCIGAR